MNLFISDNVSSQIYKSLTSKSSLFWTIYLPSFLLTFSISLLIPILPSFIKELGVGVGLVGLGISAVLIGNMFFDIPVGLLISKQGKKRSMLFGTLLMIFFPLLIITNDNFSIFFILRFFVGGAIALWSISRMSYVAHLVPVNNRGRVLATLGGVHRIGMFFGPVIGGIAGARLGFNSVFVLQSIICFFTLFIIIFIVKEDSDLETDIDTQNEVKLSFLNLLKSQRRILFIAGFAAIALNFVRKSKEIVIPLWGTYLNLGVDEIGLIIGAAAAVDLIMFAPAGIVMDKWGRKWMSVPSCIFFAFGFALLPLSNDVITFTFVSLLTGFANGLGSGSLMTLGADLAPKLNTGEFLGIWRLMGDMGAASGPIVVGQVAIISLSLSSILVALLSLGGAFLFIFGVPETLKKSKD
ncbi:MAG: hypothetical protein CL766_05880 [Chloroflexi bacterium]|nr:hypothetical protein [Chloroflexota bacterium]